MLRVLAKALYDNVAEAPDELAFVKGDIVTVIEQNTNGLEGWWLCSLNGRQGIAPGNRLKLLAGMYENPYELKKAAGLSPQQPSQQQQQQQRHSWDNTPAKVVTPQKVGQTYMYNGAGTNVKYDTPSTVPAVEEDQDYDVPPSRYPPNAQMHSEPSQETYDTPRSMLASDQGSPTQEVYDVPPIHHQAQGTVPTEIYDVPPRHGNPKEIYDVLPNHQPTEIYDVPPISHSMGPGQMPTELYDVPPRRDIPNRPEEVYDVPPEHGVPNKQTLIQDFGTCNRQAIRQPLTQDFGTLNRPALTPQHAAPNRPAFTPQQVAQNRPTVPAQHVVPNRPVMTPQQAPPSKPAVTLQHGVPMRPAMIPQMGVPNRQVVTPQQGVPNRQLFTPEYGVPTRQTKTTVLPDHLEEDYDFPHPYMESGGDVYDVPPSIKVDQYPQEVYDVPPKHIPSGMEVYDVPKSIGSMSGSEYDDDYSDYVYDVPPQVTKDRQDGVIGTQTTQSSIHEISGDIKQMSLNESKPEILPGRELNIDLDAAMDLLVKLQQRVDASVTNLLGFVSSSWRRRSSLESKIYDIRDACHLLKAVLKDFVEFSRGAAINSAKATDHNLQRKLKTYLQPLEDTLTILNKSLEVLDDMDWQVTKLCMTESLKSPDELDQIVMCARSMPEDVRQIASIIHGNSTLIFKRSRQNSNSPVQSRPLPTPPGSKGSTPKHSPTSSPVASLKMKSNLIKTEAEKDITQARLSTGSPGHPNKKPNQYGRGWLDDYDYVHLEGKESFERRQRELLQKGDIMKQEQLQLQHRKQMAALEKEATEPVNSDPSTWSPPRSNRQSLLQANDRHILTFYADQLDSLIISLNNAIDAFFSAVNSNQAPKVFVAHGKFVILCAHKLVFIGDTLHRSVENNDIRNKITHSTDALCECVKVTVASIKTAALEYPAIQAMQEMVDRVTDISHTAQHLKHTICQFAAL
ncbi:enhancer of filamentation 1-like isoform X2 [Glandiceps talaboti]